jgi:hypothetical protein
MAGQIKVVKSSYIIRKMYGVDNNYESSYVITTSISRMSEWKIGS